MGCPIFVVQDHDSEVVGIFFGGHSSSMCCFIGKEAFFASVAMELGGASRTQPRNRDQSRSSPTCLGTALYTRIDARKEKKTEETHTTRL